MLRVKEVARSMNTIVIAVDGSGPSDAALRTGLEIAEAEDAAVVLVHVAPSTDVLPVSLFGTTASVEHAPTAADVAPLTAAAEVADAHGVRATTRLLSGDAADEIVACADALRADLVVVGSRGLGALGRMILGSVSRAVLRETRVPVLVVREVEAPVVARRS
jgi:nucleotide-binding universal stress UspA family protein